MKRLALVFKPEPLSGTDDWARWKAEEEAIDKALEYAFGGRL